MIARRVLVTDDVRDARDTRVSPIFAGAIHPMRHAMEHPILGTRWHIYRILRAHYAI